MMRRFQAKALLSGAFLCLAAAVAGAQTQSTDRTAYFMDGYLLRNRVNPAQYSYRDYVSVGVGNINAGLNSNFGIKTFLYPDGNGNLDTFLSPRVDENTFLSRLNNYNPIMANVDVDVLGMGFVVGDGSYANLSVGVKGSVKAAVPYDLFRFLKSGSTSGNQYGLAGMGVRGRVIAEAGYGMSFPIGDIFRWGFKLKGLVGLASLDASMQQFDLSLTGEEWTVRGNGVLEGSAPLTIGTKTFDKDPSVTDMMDFSNITFNLNSFRPYGYGGALDVGFIAEPLSWLKASAAVLDLGAIKWNRNICGVMDAEYKFTGVTIDPGSSGNLGDQLEKELDGLSEFLVFRERAAAGGGFEMVPMTFNAGVQVYLPFWKALSAGLLYTQHLEQAYSWYEARAVANFCPLSWFGLSASYARSTFGDSLGAALHLQLPLLELFAAVETPTLVFSKPYSFYEGIQPIPVPIGNLNLMARVGLSLCFGQKFETPHPEAD